MGRVQSVILLVHVAPVPLALVLAGVLLDTVGDHLTIAVFAGLLALVATSAIASSTIRGAAR